MKEKQILLLVVLAVVVLQVDFAIGANIYVNGDTGSDITGDGSPTEVGNGPYKTIDYAYNQINDGDTIFLEQANYDPNTQGNPWYIHIDRNNIGCTIKAVADADVILFTNMDHGSIRISADDTPSNKKTASFEGITFENAYDSRWFIYYDSEKELNLSLSDCVFDTSSTKPLFGIFQTVTPPVSRSMFFTRLEYHNTKPSSVTIQNVDMIVFDECTLVHNCNTILNPMISLKGNIGLFELKNSNITSNNHFFAPNVSGLVVNKVVIHNNTFIHNSVSSSIANDYSIYLQDNAEYNNVKITDNTFNCTADSGYYSPIRAGATNPSYLYKLRGPVISGNTLNSDIPGYYGTGIVLGVNVLGASVTDNIITGFQTGIYNSSNGSFIANNIVKCIDSIVIPGGCANDIRNNTFISIDAHKTGRAVMFNRYSYASASSKGASNTFTATSFTDSSAWNLTDVPTDKSAIAIAYDLDVSSPIPDYYGVINGKSVNQLQVISWIKRTTGLIETPFPAENYRVESVKFGEKNVLINNIIDSLDAMHTITFDFNPRCGEDYIDYNCYRIGTSGRISNLALANIYNLNDLRSIWSTWSDMYPLNDAHSIQGDPGFVDAANNDFRLNPTSSCLNAGKPTIGGGFTTIGAWDGISSGFSAVLNCSMSIEMDFNYDCRVDLYDFAMFVQDWLECNLEPQSVCC